MFQTKMYVKELLDYLNTVTIKNELIADHMFDTWVSDEFKTLLPPELHPYYRSLVGDYILKDLSSLDELLGVDRSSMTIAEYKLLLPTLEQEAKDKYGLSIRSTINGVSYLNSSIYTRFNDLVIVDSMDDQTRIPLTKKIVDDLNHVKTIASYKIPNLSFYTLCEKNPSSVALIKAILYPIPTQSGQDGIFKKQAIQIALDADNFSLLSSNESCLEEQEQTSITDCLNRTLLYIKNRWGVREFAYEDLYSCAHEAVVWNMLFLALIVQRIKNIKTYSAHSYHIWEYIKSHGLGDHRTVLNRQQTLFLYKNLPYLIKHKGTEKVLELLSYVFLMPWNIRLNNKIMAQQTNDVFEEKPAYKESGYLIPTVISKRVGETMFKRLDELLSSTSLHNMSYQQLLVELEKVAGKDYGSVSDLESTSLSYDTFDTLLNKEKESGLEYQNDNLFERSSSAQNKALSITPHNLLKTKLLEIKSPASSIIFETLYARFVTQQILYRSSTDSLRFAITFMPAVSDTFITLRADEAIALLMYSISREKGYHPEQPPEWTHITMAYKQDVDVTTDIVDRFYSVKENKYSASILKLVDNAYGFDVSGDSVISGLYIPHNPIVWKNTRGSIDEVSLVNTSIVWKGLLENAPESPEVNWAYQNTTDGKSYLYNGIVWKVLAKNDTTLEYNGRLNRWEFKKAGKLVFYSSALHYHINNMLLSDVLWDMPMYWFDTKDKRCIISVDKILNPALSTHYKLSDELYTHPTAYTSVENFSDTIHNQAKSYVSMFAEAGYPASNVYSDFLYALHEAIVVNDVVALNLLKGKTYKQFFSSDSILSAIINNIDISSKPEEEYAKLSSAILDSLFPITDSIKTDPEYILNMRYTLLKDLFISMCSYNVAFLTATRVDATPYTIPRLSAHHTKMGYSTVYHEDVCNEKFNIKVDYRMTWNDMNSMVVREYL